MEYLEWFTNALHVENRIINYKRTYEIIHKLPMKR